MDFINEDQRLAGHERDVAINLEFLDDAGWLFGDAERVDNLGTSIEVEFYKVLVMLFPKALYCPGLSNLACPLNAINKCGFVLNIRIFLHLFANIAFVSPKSK